MRWIIKSVIYFWLQSVNASSWGIIVLNTYTLKMLTTTDYAEPVREGRVDDINLKNGFTTRANTLNDVLCPYSVCVIKISSALINYNIYASCLQWRLRLRLFDNYFLIMQCNWKRGWVLTQMHLKPTWSYPCALLIRTQAINTDRQLDWTSAGDCVEINANVTT